MDVGDDLFIIIAGANSVRVGAEQDILRYSHNRNACEVTLNADGFDVFYVFLEIPRVSRPTRLPITPHIDNVVFRDGNTIYIAVIFLAFVS